jgi:hypothetical protein
MRFRWFVAFSFLLLAIHEAHELAHAIAGRLLCGMWPVRDFNSWLITGGCASWLPAAAGPALSYALILIGALMAVRSQARWTGVALLFAANPFARIFTAAMGGGDEMVVAQRVADLSTRTPALRLIVAALVTLVCGAGIAAGWRTMAGLQRRGLWFAIVLLWPMVVTGALFVFGNGLLRANVLASPTIGGAPLLVFIVSAASAVLALATARSLNHAPQPVPR